MSGLSLTGKVEANSNIKNIIIDDKKINLNSDGSFSFICNIFQGKSGESESSRLKLPLLGKININSKLSESCDRGIPFVKEYPESMVRQEFQKISDKIVQL